LISLYVETHFVHQKKTYFVTAKRDKAKAPIEVKIFTDEGKETPYTEAIYTVTLDARHAFGSGVCRTVLDSFLYQQKTGKPRTRWGGGLPRVTVHKPEGSVVPFGQGGRRRGK
jgi:hypothetical protein